MMLKMTGGIGKTCEVNEASEKVTTKLHTMSARVEKLTDKVDHIAGRVDGVSDRLDSIGNNITKTKEELGAEITMTKMQVESPRRTGRTFTSGTTWTITLATATIAQAWAPRLIQFRGCGRWSAPRAQS